MRNLDKIESSDCCRLDGPAIIAHYGSAGDETCGAFSVASPIDRGELRVVASCGAGWEHVSVSRQNRCPNWLEMSHVHRLFFMPDEACVQYHVPVSDHVNCHPFCLHIWRPIGVELPRPPEILVGPEEKKTTA